METGWREPSAFENNAGGSGITQVENASYMLSATLTSVWERSSLWKAWVASHWLLWPPLPLVSLPAPPSPLPPSRDSRSLAGLMAAMSEGLPGVPMSAQRVRPGERALPGPRPWPWERGCHRATAKLALICEISGTALCCPESRALGRSDQQSFLQAAQTRPPGGSLAPPHPALGPP